MPVTNFDIQITDPVLDDHIAFNGTRFINTPSATQAVSTFGSVVQYVETYGLDTNSGADRSHPKLTVKAAVNALQGTSHTGTVYVGCGIFEEDPIILKERLRIIGGGAEGGAPAGGTTIRLKAGSNAPLFAPAAPGGFMHYTHLEKLTLDGNRDNQSGDYDVLQLEGGGFNCILRDLHVRNSGRWGILMNGAAVNLQTSNISGGYCGRLPVGVEVYDPTVRGGFLFFNKDRGGANDNITMFGTQLDVCGRYPIFINHKTNLGGNIAIIGLKLELAGTHDHHKAAIGYAGKNGTVNDRPHIQVTAGRSDNYFPPDTPIAFVHQLSGTSEVAVTLNQVQSSGTFVLYKNDVTGYSFSARNSVESFPVYSNIGRLIVKDLNLRCPTYANDAAAAFGGLEVDGVYKTATGELRIKL